MFGTSKKSLQRQLEQVGAESTRRLNQIQEAKRQRDDLDQQYQELAQERDNLKLKIQELEEIIYAADNQASKNRVLVTTLKDTLEEIYTISALRIGEINQNQKKNPENDSLIKNIEKQNSFTIEKQATATGLLKSELEISEIVNEFHAQGFTQIKETNFKTREIDRIKELGLYSISLKFENDSREAPVKLWVVPTP